MLQLACQVTIVTSASIWLIVALGRFRQGRTLGPLLKWSVWLPLIVAGLAVVLSVWKTAVLYNLLHEAGALTEDQGRLWMEKTAGESVVFLTLGIAASGIMWAVARYDRRSKR